MDGDIILYIVVATALAFDFTNGFHDTANVVATSISTRAMPPRLAVTLAALLNFVGAFLSLEVAATVASGIVNAGAITEQIVFAGLIGAIAWNLATWYFGLPSSSSHALIGGVVGAMFAAEGTSAINGDGLLGKVLVPALIAPLARLRRAPAWRSSRLPHRRPAAAGPGEPRLPPRPAPVRRPARALARHERRPEDDGRHHARADRPRHHLGRRLPCADLGRRLARHRDRARHLPGGWRIIKTMGSRIIKMDTAQGFSAQGAGAAVILASSHFGYPLSTTHVISGGVMGAGAARRLSAVRWGVAGNMIVAWILTIPAAGAIGASPTASPTFRHGRGRAVVVSILIIASAALVFGRRVRRGPAITAAAETLMAPLAQIVDWATLGEVVVYSILAGVGLSRPRSRSWARRGASTRAATAAVARRALYAVLWPVGVLAATGAVVFGVVVMTVERLTQASAATRRWSSSSVAQRPPTPARARGRAGRGRGSPPGRRSTAASGRAPPTRRAWSRHAAPPCARIAQPVGQLPGARRPRAHGVPAVGPPTRRTRRCTTPRSRPARRPCRTLGAPGAGGGQGPRRDPRASCSPATPSRPLGTSPRT